MAWWLSTASAEVGCEEEASTQGQGEGEAQVTARLVAIAVAIVALIPLAGWGPAAFAAFTVAVWWAALRGRRRPAQRRRNRRVWTEQERRFILDRDRWACVECGSADELEIDHVIPFSRGGACTVDNAQVLCGPCNRRKGAN